MRCDVGRMVGDLYASIRQEAVEQRGLESIVVLLRDEILTEEFLSTTKLLANRRARGGRTCGGGDSTRCVAFRIWVVRQSYSSQGCVACTICVACFFWVACQICCRGKFSRVARRVLVGLPRIPLPPILPPSPRSSSHPTTQILPVPTHHSPILPRTGRGWI